MVEIDREKIKQQNEKMWQYARDYYHANKVPQQCIYCGKSLASVGSYSIHLMKNRKCRKIRLENNED